MVAHIGVSLLAFEFIECAFSEEENFSFDREGGSVAGHQIRFVE